MAQWTNDRWRSTLHRVMNPERNLAGQARMSIVFFQQPNEDAVISCLPTCMDADHPAKYESVSAGAHVAAKLEKGWMAQSSPRVRVCPGELWPEIQSSREQPESGGNFRKRFHFTMIKVSVLV
jgi:hypothetical protein